LPDGRECGQSLHASIFSRSSAGFSALLHPVRFLRGLVSDNCLKKRYQFAGGSIQPPGVTGWISVPFASLGGELAGIRVNKILLPARDRRRARTRRPNLL